MTEEATLAINVETLRPPVKRAIAAWKELQQNYVDALAIIDAQAGMMDEGALIIEELKAALEETWPEDVGGSTGGVVG